MSAPEIVLLANRHCTCGENPLWDERRGGVFWTDIPNGRVFRYDLATERDELVCATDAAVGGFTLQENGELLLFRERDFAALAQCGAVRVLREFDDPTLARFNDVIAAPDGGIFAGSIGSAEDDGGLYRIERDGSMRKLFAGTGCANGMGFSPDRRWFYWTCSTTKQIFRFRYDEATGNIAERELFYAADDTEGIPDGLTVDVDGSIWSARWDGHALLRHDPTGAVRERIEFPVAKVSSVCFGGDDRRTLFVTTAGGTGDSDTLDGALFSVRVERPGGAEFRSQVLL